MSDDHQKLYDFQVGQLTGTSYGAYSGLGKSFHSQPSSSPSFTPVPVRKTGKFDAKIVGGSESPKNNLTKAERKAYKKKVAEQIAAGRDVGFTKLLVLACAGGMGYVDYTYKPEWEWWAHASFILVPSILFVVLLTKLKLVRPLRRTVTAAVVVGVAYGVLVLFSVVPSIAFIWAP